jgi:hypothetical protein
VFKIRARYFELEYKTRIWVDVDGVHLSAEGFGDLAKEEVFVTRVMESSKRTHSLAKRSRLDFRSHQAAYLYCTGRVGGRQW